ncbi:Stk1 family PASTA domain-containing Ser/Thr kinase [Heyndrickxia acidiproducens]|uniref:Stk1 family PASTA domain-containing Ser/Thr kinase n=1 Tax=Heyndrickxia acidiproducens TaxID=1121084 RepID=UPI00035FB6BA|nr:Stk1 family PASTA domain-containing Ser/Thr kinase [Heyndrickxia acidiproducens]
MLIGRRISGRYKVLTLIGGGGMANVYLAHDMILDRNVAVKILRLDFANEPEFIKRFHREAQSATSLVHPNIVSIYDIGEEDDINYIVMENVEGMTLKQYIQQNGPVSVEKTLDIMGQLTAAIFHAHQNHIIHRDIKPQNILIDHDGVVKITDFGIAMALSATSITQTNAVLGSVHYLSPEQARGGMATYKSDIYALGIVMFELLTGRLPFSGESAVSIALKHLQTETPPPKRWNPDIPQSVENIVLKATAKDPFHRYNDADEMGEDIRTALNPERANEPKFDVPEDDEKTITMPVLTEARPAAAKNDETIMLNAAEEKKEAKKAKKHGRENKKRRKKWPFVLGSLALLAVLAGLFALLLPSILGPKTVSVPDIKGKEASAAAAVLAAHGLKAGEKITTASETVPKGKIIKTDPSTGANIKEGTEVTLYISGGKAKYSLSDYTGRQYDDIIRLLSGEHFKDIQKEEVYDDSIEGTILSQDPKPNAKVVPENTVITFKVSKGVEKVTVQDLSGFSKNDLNHYANESGFSIDSTEKAYSDTVKKGLVISQTPAAGAVLDKGSTVKVVISKGQEELPPKTVHKEVTIPYEPDETDSHPDDTGSADTSVTGDSSGTDSNSNDSKSNDSKDTGSENAKTDGQSDDQDQGRTVAAPVKQEVQIYIDDMNHNMSDPVETFEITKTVKKQLEFTIESGKTATYKIVRDGKVIEEDTVSYPD